MFKSSRLRVCLAPRMGWLHRTQLIPIAAIAISVWLVAGSATAAAQDVYDSDDALQGAQAIHDTYFRALGQGQELEWPAFNAGMAKSGLEPQLDAGAVAGPKNGLAYYQMMGDTSGVTDITITNETLHHDTKRLGINLSAPTTYEASMIMKNIVENPGFENAVFGMVFHTDSGATGTRLPMAFWETAWNNDEMGIGHPEGYWEGAAYEVVYGAAKGRRGFITNFAHENNRNVFYLDGTGAVPSLWDVVFVRKKVTGIASRPDPTTVRPGSPGAQSMKMAYPGQPTREAFVQYWDTMGRHGDVSAGKLFKVKGVWRIAFWAKALTGGTRVNVKFMRPGEVVFADKTFVLSTSWQLYEHQFTVDTNADRLTGYSTLNKPPFLMFGMYMLDPGTQVWADDLEIARVDQRNPTAFTDNLVDRLKELKPGIVRDWSTQLGDTLDNQISPTFARKTHDFRPRLRRAGLYTYSLHEFLELCREVETEPWYVIPPTFSPEDLANLVAYLSAPVSSNHPYALKRAALGQQAPWTTEFPTIHLEYGNEMWGGASGTDPFMGASALGGERLGAIAHNRFALLKASPYFRPQQMHLVIGGQAAYPGRQSEIDTYSSNHNEIAIAPYFGTISDAATTDEQLFYPLLAKAYHDVGVGKPLLSRNALSSNGKNTSLGVYEINFHTTGGAATTEVLNDFMTSGGGGLALPLYMLLYQRELGVVNQCAFNALQYSFLSQGYVRIWGTLRDLEATERKRPTWLGMELANKAIRGKMVRTIVDDASPVIVQQPINGLPEATQFPMVESFAFRDGERYSIYLTNLSVGTPRRIRLHLPFGTGGLATLYKLVPPTMRADNEDREDVSIQWGMIDTFTSPYEFVLPAHSAYVFRWSQSENVPSLSVPWWTDR